MVERNAVQNIALLGVQMEFSHRSVIVQCPENFYGNESGIHDLLDRCWCGNLIPETK
jgi:hypothetical protein